MAARSTMAELISLVRTIINDTGSVAFTDDETIEDYLDMEIHAEMSHKLMSKNVEELIYYSPYKFLEDTVVIYDGPSDDAATISSSTYTANLIKGTFTFTSDQDDDYYMSGTAYRLDAAVARCFEQLANDPTKTRSWAQSGGEIMTRNELFSTARYYRRLAGAKPGVITKSYGS